MSIDNRIRVLWRGSVQKKRLADGTVQTYPKPAQLEEGKHWVQRGNRYFFSEEGVRKV